MMRPAQTLSRHCRLTLTSGGVGGIATPADLRHHPNFLKITAGDRAAKRSVHAETTGRMSFSSYSDLRDVRDRTKIPIIGIN